jgi:acyl dehydratase
VAEFAVVPAIVTDPELALDFTRVVHGDQEYEHRRPLRIGETLTVRSTITSIRQKGGLAFLTIETELVGDDGNVAAIGRSTMIERPVGR